jgi:hypothetical protein
VLEVAHIGLNAGMGDVFPHMKTKYMIADRQMQKCTAQSAYLETGNMLLPIPPLIV